MLKAIGMAVVGYIVVFIGVFLLMTLSWVAVGTNGAFLPGSWEVTGLWIGLLIFAGFAAALLAGYVTELLSSDPRTTTILIGIVVVLGFLLAIPVLTGSMPAPPDVRPDDLAMFDAMNNGQQPSWVALLNPLIGGIGVWVGSKLRSRSDK